VLDDVDELLN